jgi:hypothetical protein
MIHVEGMMADGVNGAMERRKQARWLGEMSKGVETGDFVWVFQRKSRNQWRGGDGMGIND